VPAENIVLLPFTYSILALVWKEGAMQGSTHVNRKGNRDSENLESFGSWSSVFHTRVGDSWYLFCCCSDLKKQISVEEHPCLPRTGTVACFLEVQSGS
jgi:hypothetical protein